MLGVAVTALIGSGSVVSIDRDCLYAWTRHADGWHALSADSNVMRMGNGSRDGGWRGQGRGRDRMQMEEGAEWRVRKGG